MPSGWRTRKSENPRQPLFFFGADRLGRCVYSRIMLGTQISLSVGLVGVFLALTIGIVPFVIADLVKIAIGAALLPYAQRFVTRVS